jgi:hypothetical protein
LGIVRNAIVHGRRISEKIDQRSQMFSHAQRGIRFMGTAKLAFITAARMMRTHPVVMSALHAT